MKGDWRTSSLRAFGKHFQNTFAHMFSCKVWSNQIAIFYLIETCPEQTLMIPLLETGLVLTY